MNWIGTKAGLQMAETIIRQLPRITICLEEIALGLNYLRRLENREKSNEQENIKHDKVQKGVQPGVLSEKETNE